MIVDELLDANFEAIIDAARYAPSVHNTQPWRVKRLNDGIYITLDEVHTLTYGDPTGRESVMSLGIFAEAIIMVAAAIGLSVKSLDFSSNELTITFKHAKSIGSFDKIKNLLRNRVTDRSIYRSTNLTKKQISNIKNSWLGKEAQIHVIDDDKTLEELAGLTAQGISLALTNPAFRTELSGLLIEPWSSKKRGISVRSLYIPSMLQLIEPVFMKFGIGLKAEARLEKRRWQSASAAVCITTPGDMPKYWLAAGRAYMRVAICIESLGLSQATSAATVEASNFHEDVEELLEVTQRLQSTIRIGLGSPRKMHSPRVDLDSIITTSN